MDAESAYIVLEEYTCSTHIATWEFTCRNKLSWVRASQHEQNPFLREHYRPDTLDRLEQI